MYRTLSNAKIVLNGAGEVGGRDRGNMRCFEAMGCGALMLTDEGIYPAGMVDGQTMATYRDPADAVAAIERLLAADEERTMIARNGLEMISTVYSKKEQWTRFQAIVQ